MAEMPAQWGGSVLLPDETDAHTGPTDPGSNLVPTEPPPPLKAQEDYSGAGRDAFDVANPVHMLTDALGYVGQKGRDFSNFMYGGAAKAGLPAAAEGYMRSAGSSILGNQLLADMPKQRAIDASRTRTDVLGPTLGDASMIGANVGAQVAPMLGLGWAKAGQATLEGLEAGKPMLEKILELAKSTGKAALGGGAIGTGQSAVAGEDPTQGGILGALFGAATHTLGAAGGYMGEHLKAAPEGTIARRWGDFLGKNRDLSFGSVKEGARELAVLAGDSMDHLAEQILSVGESKVPPEVAARQKVEGSIDPSSIGTRVREGELKPSVILYHTDPDGNVYASVNEFRADGTRKFWEHSIDTADDAAKIGAIAKNKDVAVGFTPDAIKAGAALPPEIVERLFQGNRPLLASDASIKGTNPGRVKSIEGLPNLDQPIATQRSDATATVDRDGHIKFTPLPQTRPLGDMPEVGETIFIQAGGKKYPGVYHGEDSITGKSVVQLGHDANNLGSIEQVSQHQLVRAPPEQRNQLPLPAEGLGGGSGSGGAFPKGPTRAGGPFKKGDYGFIRNPQGGYLTVKVVGNSSTPGELMVTMGNGQAPVSMKAAEIDPRMPPGIPNLSHVQTQKSAPLSAEQIAGMDPHDAQVLELDKQAYDSLSNRQPGLVDKFLQQVAGGQVRGSVVMREAHLRMQGSRALLKTQSDMLNNIWAKMPKGSDRVAFSEDLGKVFDGSKSWGDFVTKHGAAAEEAMKTYGGAAELERETLDRRLAELEMIPNQLILERAKGQLEPYVARVYMRDLLPPGKWAKIAHEQAPAKFDAAVEFLRNQLSEGGKYHVAQEEVSAALETTLKSSNMDELAKGGNPVAKVFNRLKARGDIPKVLRDVMGEVTRGDIRIASTLASQRSLVAMGELFQDISSNPELSSIGRRADMYPEPVPDMKAHYGKLSGKYVRPEIYNELINLPQQIHNSWGFANQVSGFLKGNQLASFGPWWTSLKGNIQGTMLAGGIDITRPVEGFKTIQQAAKAWHDYHVDPSGKTGDGWLILEAKKAGADWAGHGETMIQSSSKRFVSAILKEMGQGDGTHWSAFNAIKKAYDLEVKGTQLFGHLLDTQDQVFRIANYIGLRRKNVGAGMEESEAAMAAARKIAQNFPNPENVGPLVKKMRNATGLLNQFLTAKLEDVRIRASIVEQVQEEGMRMPLRLAAWGMAMYGVTKGVRMMSGINEEQIHATEESMTKRSKTYRPGLYAMPVRDEHGRVQFLDMTSGIPELELMAGNPDDSMWRRVVYNLGTYPVQGGLLETPVQHIAQGFGLIRGPKDPMQPLEGESGLAQGINLAGQAGVAPRILTQALQIGRKTMVGGDYSHPQTLGPGDLGRREEPLTPGQAAANMGGLKVLAAGKRGEVAAKAEILSEYNDLVKQLRTVPYRVQDKAKQKEITQAIVTRMKDLAAQMHEKNSALKDAKENP